MGFSPVNFSAPPFHLAGLIKKGESMGELVVYLEGDGEAIVKGRPSMDPTPRNQLSLDLALMDPAPAVLYLARVGQFLPEYASKRYQIYWSDKRLSQEVVTAASAAIDSAKEMTGSAFVHLVGFSGGGGLAVLLAESRNDVLSLVTVAGLLDTVWWTRNGGWKPLAGLNPSDLAGLISNLPQVHFYGTKDKVIPPELSLVYASKGKFTNLQRVSVPTGHNDVWTKLWRDLLNKYVLPIRDKANQGSRVKGSAI
jgi:pimeloyl-ACP methyl ester carboxylesterase